MKTASKISTIKTYLYYECFKKIPGAHHGEGCKSMAWCRFVDSNTSQDKKLHKEAKKVKKNFHKQQGMSIIQV